jgi:histidinol-phosphate phosphatase family protein
MKKILVIRIGAIGDVILTSPAILNLKLSFPDSSIHFLTRSHIAGLLQQFAGVDEIIDIPGRVTSRDLFRMGEYLDKIGFDIFVDLHGNIRSKYLAHHVTAPVKVQYHKRRLERYLGVKFKKINQQPPHTIDLYNDAVERCGGKIFARRPILHLKGTHTAWLGFDNALPTVAIAPGASFPTKRWFPKRFYELALDILNQIPANVVLVLTDRDENMSALRQEAPADRLRILRNADLSELAHAIWQADLMICNDSALSHLASAVGTPVIAIFGPTHPTLGFAPRGRHDVIMQVDEYCRPCSLHGKRTCYRDEQYCFSKLTVADVFDRAGELIKNNSKGNKAIFVDRDGTLIKEKGFLDNPGEVEPEENSITAVRMAREAGFKIVVVSNQSGLARGYFEEDSVRLVNSRILKIFADSGAQIDDILFCPHLPEAEIVRYRLDCECRKPKPGMVELASHRHNINPYLSYVVGDKLSDVHLAYVVGAKGILVRTGFGRREQEKLTEPNSLQPVSIEENLFDAVKYIIGQRTV